MNSKVKNFIFNGLAYGIAFFILSFITGYYSARLPLRQAVLISIPIAGLAFLMNGLIQSRFTKSTKKLHLITIVLQDFEELKIAAPANHIVDDHLISGRLFLTEKRLVFKSFQQEEYSWLLTNLQPYKFYPSIFNTGGEFIVMNSNNDKLVFEVDEIRVWKKALIPS